MSSLRARSGFRAVCVCWTSWIEALFSRTPQAPCWEGAGIAHGSARQGMNAHRSSASRVRDRGPLETSGALVDWPDSADPSGFACHSWSAYGVMPAWSTSSTLICKLAMQHNAVPGSHNLPSGFSARRGCHSEEVAAWIEDTP